MCRIAKLLSISKLDENILSAIQQMLDGRAVKVSNEYLDTQGACFYLSISKSTLYKMNLRNVIPYFRPTGSKKIYYKPSDLEKYITENRLMSQQEINDQAASFLQRKKGGHDV